MYTHYNTMSLDGFVSSIFRSQPYQVCNHWKNDILANRWSSYLEIRDIVKKCLYCASITPREGHVLIQSSEQVMNILMVC